MATRLYPPSAGTPAITPTKDAIWDAEAAGYATYPISTVKSGSTMATVTFSDSDDTFKDCIMRQYVTGPIAAQTIQAQTITLIIRGSQPNANNNMHIQFGARVLSNDGTVVRGTLLPANTFEAAEPTSSLVSRKVTGTTTQVISTAGDDRIVFEIGAQGNPGIAATHTYSLRIGDAAATDLDNGTGEADDDAPWIEFATDTIVFVSSTISPTPVAIPVVIPAPTITLTKTISPSAVAIPIVIPSPLIAITQTKTPSPVTIPIVIPAPVVTVSSTQTITPSPVAILIVIPAPTVNGITQTITPSPVTIPIVIPAPSIGIGEYQAYQSLTRLLNPTDWGGSPTLILEIHGFTSSAGSPFKAHLFNLTDSGIVSGSQISSANTILDRLRSSSFSLAAGSKEYEVRYGGASGATYTVEDAVLIVSP